MPDDFDMALTLTALLLVLLSPMMEPSMMLFMALLIFAAFVARQAGSGRPGNPKG